MTAPTVPPHPIRPRRCVLFFPATRPDRLEKAAEAGADAVCMDLEDAVPPDEKGDGRNAAMETLGRPFPPNVEVLLRVNSPRTRAGLQDLLSLAESERAPDGIVIPKVDHAAEVGWVDELLAHHPDLSLVPMIETAAGLAAAADIARASLRTSALLFGGLDLSIELGCGHDWNTLLFARSAVVHAAALGQVDALDMPYLDVGDPIGLSAESGWARTLGFVGKAAIHPSQVELVRDAFSPGKDDIEQAQLVLEAASQSQGRAVLLDGKLVDQPVIRAAERTLATARLMEVAEE